VYAIAYTRRNLRSYLESMSHFKVSILDGWVGGWALVLEIRSVALSNHALHLKFTFFALHPKIREILMVVLLDNIRSLHNVGSILRTADAVGVEKLYLCGITPSPLDRFGVVRGDVAKVALGAERTVPWEKVASTGRLITNLKRKGFKVFALEQSPHSVSYNKLSSKAYNFDRVALVLGAEVGGVSPAILKKCDKIIEIPMLGNKESINVSVAFGVAAFRLRD